MESLLKYSFLGPLLEFLIQLIWCRRFCISNKLPGDVAAAGLGITL